MWRNGRDGRQFRSAVRKPLDQAREVFSQPAAIAAPDVPHHKIHVRLDYQKLSRVGLSQLPIVVQGGAGAQAANQSETSHVSNSRRTRIRDLSVLSLISGNISYRGRLSSIEDQDAIGHTRGTCPRRADAA